jgi:glucose-6-phosphate dehydrogenase assembly protein OpcA
VSAAAGNDAVLGEVWRADDTTPAAIEEALRALLQESHATNQTHAARVLNLVAVVDAEWRGEIENRLAHVGRYHGSRTIICAIEPRRTQLDAWATVTGSGGHAPGELASCEERVTIDIGTQHLDRLETIVDPILVGELTTVVWSPHGHPEAVDALLGLADAVLVDSLDQPELGNALERASRLASQAYVVDLAWLRSTPWRERIAATFDPPAERRALWQISAVSVRYRPDSAVAALLLIGWLASRLGWEPRALVGHNGSLRGRFHGRRQDIDVALDSTPELGVPGLAGVTVKTAAGLEISLERGDGGLVATRLVPGKERSTWTVLGASRGEGGILGEGVRQALLRDPTYAPALAGAQSMVA